MSSRQRQQYSSSMVVVIDPSQHIREDIQQQQRRRPADERTKAIRKKRRTSDTLHPKDPFPWESNLVGGRFLTPRDLLVRTALDVLNVVQRQRRIFAGSRSVEKQGTSRTKILACCLLGSKGLTAFVVRQQWIRQYRLLFHSSLLPNGFHNNVTRTASRTRNHPTPRQRQ